MHQETESTLILFRECSQSIAVPQCREDTGESGGLHSLLLGGRHRSFASAEGLQIRLKCTNQQELLCELSVDKVDYLSLISFCFFWRVLFIFSLLSASFKE